MSSNYRGGRSSYRGGGGGRSSRPSGGRSHNYNSNHSSSSSGPQVLPAKFRPCKTFLTSGSCPNGSNCRYAHIVQLHATIDAAPQPHQQQSFNNNNNNNKLDNSSPKNNAVSSVALWPQPDGSLKIFTGSHDGFWRLWNAAGGFAKEFETQIATKVECLSVVNNFLFCGMQAMAVGLSGATVGMLHAWNLNSPNQPPLELQVDPPFLNYAHNQTVSAICVQDTTVVTGSQDGSIRIWKFVNNAFQLDSSIPGHARQVTGLIVVENRLWSSSTDGSIRIWDLATGKCQYAMPNPTAAANNSQTSATPTAQATQTGHTHAVTDLVSFTSQGAWFVLSSSLDGTIKAWKAATGECVATESHGEGVVTLTLVPLRTDEAATTPPPPNVLMIGLESGNIVCRNLTPQGNVKAFEALFVLTPRFNVSHQAAVQCLQAGPQATFYSGSADGKLMVWQITGDLLK